MDIYDRKQSRDKQNKHQKTNRKSWPGWDRNTSQNLIVVFYIFASMMVSNITELSTKYFFLFVYSADLSLFCIYFIFINCSQFLLQQEEFSTTYTAMTASFPHTKKEKEIHLLGKKNLNQSRMRI